MRRIASRSRSTSAKTERPLTFFTMTTATEQTLWICESCGFIYDPAIGEPAVSVMNGFARSLGLLSAPVSYEDTVATRFRDLWLPASRPR